MPSPIDLKDIKEQTGYLTYSRDVVHSYSKGIGKLLDLFINHIDVAIQAKKNGKEVVWVERAPLMLMYACGAIPIAITDIARLGKMESIRTAEEFFHIPAETCAMVKEKIGGFYGYRHAPCKKIVLGRNICEPAFAASTLMKEFGYETHIFDIIEKPRRDTEGSVEFAKKKYEEELEKLSLWISGKPFDKEALHSAMIRANRINKKTHYILEMQHKHPTYMKSLPSMLLISGRDGYYGQPEAYEAVVDEIIAEFEALPEGTYNEKRVKLLWSGGRGIDFSVYNAVDVSGGYITRWNIVGSGSRPFDEDIDPLEAYLEHNFTGRNSRGMKEVNELDERIFHESGAAGVIIYLTQGCTHLVIGREVRRKYLNDKNIPTLFLSGTAQIGEATGQIMTRIKAFIEMLS